MSQEETCYKDHNTSHVLTPVQCYIALHKCSTMPLLTS